MKIGANNEQKNTCNFPSLKGNQSECFDIHFHHFFFSNED